MLLIKIYYNFILAYCTNRILFHRCCRDNLDFDRTAFPSAHIAHSSKYILPFCNFLLNDIYIMLFVPHLCKKSLRYYTKQPGFYFQSIESSVLLISGATKVRAIRSSLWYYSIKIFLNFKSFLQTKVFALNLFKFCGNFS